MMERRYIAVRTVGDPEKILNKIRNAVTRMHMTKTIPVVKLEAKPRGEFYVFLAVESEAEYRLPKEISTVLSASGLGASLPGTLSVDEIKSMTARMEIKIEGFNSLKYKPVWTGDTIDPSDLSDMENIIMPADSEIQQAYDHLLYWISAIGEGTWSSFMQTCEALGLATNITQAKNVMRNMRLLGHLDNSNDGKHWFVNVPTIIFTRDESQIHLCGQRTPNLVESIKQVYAIEEKQHKGPSRIILNPSSKKHIDVFDFMKYNDSFCSLDPVEEMLPIMPDINRWRDSLEIIDRLNPSTYTFERWEENSYNSSESVIFYDGYYEGEAGLYRLTSGEGKRKFQITAYFDSASQRWLRGDWYGMRYLDNMQKGLAIAPIYNKEKAELLISQKMRWPFMYERALVLETGLLPTPVINGGWLWYKSVPEELFNHLSNKLKVLDVEKTYA